MKRSRQVFMVSSFVLVCSSIFGPNQFSKPTCQLTSVPTSEVAKKCSSLSIRVSIAQMDVPCFPLLTNCEMLCRSSHGQMPCLETEHGQKNLQQKYLPTEDFQQPDSNRPWYECNIANCLSFLNRKKTTLNYPLQIELSDSGNGNLSLQTFLTSNHINSVALDGTSKPRSSREK